MPLSRLKEGDNFVGRSLNYFESWKSSRQPKYLILAETNTISAIINGAEWVDTTITGMGRGAGNTCTENLLIELNKRKFNYKPKYLSNILPYFQLLKNHFFLNV